MIPKPKVRRWRDVVPAAVPHQTFFALTCEQLKFIPDAQCKRALKSAELKLGKLNRAAERLIKQLNKAATELKRIHSSRRTYKERNKAS